MKVKAPILRFPEFSIDYSIKSISEITNRVVNPVLVEDGVEYTEIGIRSHGRGIFHKKKTTSADIGNKRVFWIEPNLFIVNIVFAWEQAIAVTSEKEVGKIASHRFPMFKANKEEVSTEYLHRFFLTKRGKHLLGLASPGGAGRNKTLGQKEFEKLKVRLPEVKEQNKVTTFLFEIDKKISLLKQKHEQLVEYKKGIMQRLFSQQLRFKDDNGQDFPDWKKQEIGEYLVEYKERVDADTELPVLTSSRKGLVSQRDYYNDSERANEGEYGVLPLGYFTYRHMSDDLTFKFNVNKKWGKGAISKEYPVFTTKGMNSYFLEQQLNNGAAFKRFAIAQKLGGTRTRLYFKNLKKLKLNLPSEREQDKIAAFLESIDQKINLTQQQIEQTQTYKQGLLQHMFV